VFFVVQMIIKGRKTGDRRPEIANSEARFQVLRLLYLCLFSLVSYSVFKGDRRAHQVNFFFFA
jgi:hypothetical protein